MISLLFIDQDRDQHTRVRVGDDDAEFSTPVSSALEASAPLSSLRILELAHVRPQVVLDHTIDRLKLVRLVISNSD